MSDSIQKVVYSSGIKLLCVLDGHWNIDIKIVRKWKNIPQQQLD